MKRILAAVTFLFLVGCASSSSQYYEAVQKAAEANSKAAQAKYEALSLIASSGDGQAASAAVMALALSQTPTINPMPQQSEALQWASVLASPVTSLGMMWMQADSAKTMARYNSEVDLARVAATSADNQALYSSFVNSNAITGEVATAGLNAMGNVDYSMFVDGMVTLGVAGLGTADSIATTGIQTTGAVGVSGMNSLNDLGKYSTYTVGAVATAGFDSLNDLGKFGILTTAQTGVAGMEGMATISSGYNTLIGNMHSTNAATLTTLVSDANASWGAALNDSTAAWGAALSDTNTNNIFSQANYVSIVEGMQASIDALVNKLAAPVTCQDVAGTIVCN